MIRILLFLFLFPGLTNLYSQNAYYNLINGTDLNNWEIQGDGNWSLENNVIVGRKSAGFKTWGHLVSKLSFTDATISLKYNFIQGDDSGIYFRSDIRGTFGVIGVQVEIGVYDGWPLTVTETDWAFFGGSPVDSGFAKMGQWNDLVINVEGQNFTVFLNEKHVITAENITDSLLPTDGKIALQFHSGSAQTEFQFKDIEIFTPKRISGCRDSNYNEFDPQVNDHDSLACLTVFVKTKTLEPPIKRVLLLSEFKKWIYESKDDVIIWDISGKPITEDLLISDQGQIGIYFVKVSGNNMTQVLITN